MLFQSMPYVLVCIDVILVITKGSYKQHLHVVHKVLVKLRAAGMQLNINKSFFVKDRVDYLGYVKSRSGITPQTSKVKLIMDMPRPKSIVLYYLRHLTIARSSWSIVGYFF